MGGCQHPCPPRHGLPGQASTLLQAKISGNMHQVVEHLPLVLGFGLSELMPLKAPVVASHHEEYIKGSEVWWHTHTNPKREQSAETRTNPTGSRVQESTCANPRGVECGGRPALTLSDSNSCGVPNANR